MTYYGKILEDVISSPTAPLNPEPDQVWWDSTNNTIKIWKDNKWVLNTPAFTSASVDWADIEHKPSSYPPTLPIPISGVQNLDTNLNNKEPTITVGSISQYWRGDKTWQTLPPSIPDAPKDDLIYGRKNGAWVDAGGAGSGSSYTFEYSFNGNIIVPPSSGQVRLNTVDQTQATLVYMSEVTAPGIDASHVLSQFYIRQKMLIQDKDDATKWQRYAITGLPVDQGNYFEVPVQWLEGGGPVPVQRCVVDVTSPPGVEEAPLDGAIYGRSSGTWNNLSDDLALKLNLTGGTLTGPVIFGQSISAGTVATFNGLAGFNARVDLFGVENRINVANQSWITFSGDGNTQGAWAEGVRAGNLYRGYSSMASGSLRLVWGITSLNDTAPFTFYVPTTFTADVSISKTAPVLSIEKSASGQQSGIQYKTGAAGAGLLRWAAYSNNAAESGANAGSNYQILRYDDAGVGIDVPFQLVRSSGDATFSHNVNITGTGIAIYGRISSTTGTSYLYMDAPAGQGRYLRFRSVSSERWQIGVNNVAETGIPNINAGSDFVFNRFNDAGVSQGTAAYFNRYNGGLYLMSGILGIAPTAGPGNPGLGQDGEIWVTGTGLYAQINGAVVGPMGPTADVTGKVNKTGDTMTGALTINSTTTTPLTVSSSDPGTIGATITTFHDTASASDNDYPFILTAKGKDRLGATVSYAETKLIAYGVDSPTLGAYWEWYLQDSTGTGLNLTTLMQGGYLGIYTKSLGNGPTLDVSNMNANPAANNRLGKVQFSANVIGQIYQYPYADIQLRIDDPTSYVLRTGSLIFRTANAGTMSDLLYLNKTSATFATKVITPASISTSAGFNLAPGAAPSSGTADGDMWMAGSVFRYRQSGQINTFVNAERDQGFTGHISFNNKTVFSVSFASEASITIPHGVAPTAPVNGDMWSTTSGFYGRVNGVTIGPFGTAGAGGIADAPNDGITYGRKNLGWVAMSGGALSEAPTDGQQYVRSNAGWLAHDWNNLLNKPSTFAPSAHVHAESEITNLVTDLAAKASLTGATFTGKVNIPSTIAASAYLNLGTGTVSPTSPVNGDFWLNTFTLWYRSLGVSYQVLTPSSSTTITAGWAFTGKPTFAAAGFTTASLTIHHGSAPSAGASVNGDIWTTTAGIYAWINGAAQGPFIDATNAAITNKLPIAGGSMTGNLVIAPASGDSRLYLNKAASGSNSVIYGQMGGKHRWYMVLGNTVPEDGLTNVGSNFQLTALGDDGTTVLGTPIVVTRSTCIVSIPKLTSTTQVAGTSTTDVATTAFVTTADALAEKLVNKGAANGYAPLDATAKIASSYLPSYVDDVLEFANLAAFPGTGTVGVIYIDLATNKTYRWGGSSYTEISSSPGSTDAVPEGSLNLYYTNSRALAATASAYVDVAGDTMTGKLNLPASIAGSAYLNMAQGVDPTTPVVGDVWMHSTNGIVFRWGSNNYTVAHLNGQQTFTANKTFTAQSIQANAIIGAGADNASAGTGLTLWKRTSGYNEVIAFSDGAAGQRGVITMLPSGFMGFRIGDGVTDKVYFYADGGGRFTGPVTGVTEARGSNTTLFATTAHLQASEAIPNLLSGADGTTDWDTLLTPGWHNKLLGTANAHHPMAGFYYYCLVLKYGTTGITQIAMPLGQQATLALGQAMWYRTWYTAIGWTPWVSSATQAGVDAKVAKTGDTMTGHLTIGNNSSIIVDRIDGTNSPAFYHKTGGKNRWSFMLEIGTESTDQSCTGGDLRLLSYDDPGTAAKFQPAVWDRATGLLTTMALTATGKITAPASSTAGAGLRITPGVAPTTPVDGDIWTNVWDLLWRGNGGTVTAVTVETSQTIPGTKTFGNKVAFRTPSTTGASINMPHGAAPTAPADGDVWSTTAGFFERINGVTKGPFVDTTDLATKAALTHTHTQGEVTNLTSDLALKAPLASPALTGTPTAPTAAKGTNTTQIATTAHLQASGAISGTGAYEANTDFNTITGIGWYSAVVGPNAPNQPPIVNYFHIQNMIYGASEIMQMAYPLGRHGASGAIWYRGLSGGIWSNWSSLITTATSKDVLDRIPYIPTLDYTAEQLSVINTSLRTTTATYVNAVGLIKTAAINAPRITYDPTTLIKRGFMCESGKTNLAFYSQDFDNAYWTKTLSTITANVATIVSPDGLATADKLVEDTTITSSHLLTRNIAASASTIYTFSVFVKAAERTRFQLQFSGNAGSNHVNVDLTAKTVTLAGVVGWTAPFCTIKEYVNGWFRVSSTATTNAGLTSVDVAVALQDATGTLLYTGTGTSGLYLWGAQLETGLAVSSYIPTTTAAVTRAAEIGNTNILLSSFPFSDIAGTFFLEFTIDSMRSDGAADTYALFAGAVGNNVNLRAGTIIGGIDCTMSSGNVVQVDTGSRGYAYGKTVRIAVGWALNDFAFYADGGSIGAATTCLVPLAMTTLTLPSTMAQNGAITINRFMYWPKRLTNNELQILTSLVGAAV